MLEITGISYIFKYIQIEIIKCDNISQYFRFFKLYCIFDQINDTTFYRNKAVTAAASNDTNKHKILICILYSNIMCV